MADAVESVGTWRKRTAGMASANVDRATMLLMVYHRVKGTDTGERQRLLNDLLQVCRGAVGENRRGPVSPISAAFCVLALEVEKQLSRIKKAQHGWGSARKIFAPSSKEKGVFGTTKALQNYSNGSDTPTSEGNYWLEALDPKHRSWGHEDEGGRMFAEWLAAETDMSFFDWVDATKPQAKYIPSVEYLAPDQRWRYLCTFDDAGKMYRYPDQVTERTKDKPPELLSTLHMSTAHSGDCFGIWVCSPRGAFFTASHRVSEFHHSSFLAGGRVLAAGEWVIAGGYPVLITNKTGHYAATAANICQALQVLTKNGAHNFAYLNLYVLIQDYATHAHYYGTAMDFLMVGGDATRLQKIDNIAPLVEWARKLCRSSSAPTPPPEPKAPTPYGVYVNL